MRRNLTIDILLMSLFLIFGGGFASAQVGPNSIFGKKNKSEGDGPAYEIPECSMGNSDGEFCFGVTTYFSSLDFPCDLYIGVTISELGETFYTSITESEYTYLEAIDDYNEGYKVNVELGCISQETIYGLFNQIPMNDSDCFKVDEYGNEYRKSIGAIDLIYDVYCKDENGDMISVDLCEDFEEFSQILYNTSEPLENCSLAFTDYVSVCCKGLLSPEEDVATPSFRSVKKSGKSEITVSYEYPRLIVNSNLLNETNYEVYSINGVFITSGTINYTKNSIDNLYLLDGLYIIKFDSERHNSSHKFLSFR